MMKKLLVGLPLLLTVSSFADEPRKNIYPTLSSYPNWKEIDKLRHTKQDLQMTKSGEFFYGRLTALPSLVYSFGKLSFKPNEVAIILKSEKDPTKITYITNDGERYVATPESLNFSFVGDKQTLTDLSQLTLLLVNAGTEERPLIPLRNLYTLKMTNGDSVSLIFTDTSFQFGDVDKDIVPVDAIESLSREKGVHFAQGDKQEHWLPFLIKDKTFNAFIPKIDETIAIPWSDVDSIQKVNPDHDVDTIAEILPLLPKELQARVLPGVWAPSTSLIFALNDEQESDDSIHVRGMHAKETPPILFAGRQGFNIPEGIAFEGEQEYLKMSPSTILAFSEELTFQMIAMVDIEPEAFDVPLLDPDEEEEPTDSFTFVTGNKGNDDAIIAITETSHEVRLSDEQIAELKKILEREEQEIADDEWTSPFFGDREETESTEELPIDRDNTGDEQFDPIPSIHK